MGRTMPLECKHGKVMDPGDFDATVEKCFECKIEHLEEQLCVLCDMIGRAPDEQFHNKGAIGFFIEYGYWLQRARTAVSDIECY